ncbi:MAG: DMT family transporter [Odoribacter sp.]
MTKDKWQGHIAIFSTNLIFGLNTPIAKSIVPEWISPYALTLLRMISAALIFWMVSLFFKNEKVGRKDLFILFFGALFGLVGAQLSFANALLYTSPVNISIIAAMTPVAVMILAALVLKEPITFKKAAGVMIGASGALLIILQSTTGNTNPGNMIGNLLCIVNVITYAIYLVITRPISQRYSPITLMKWMFLFSTLISFPLGISDLLNARVFSDAASFDVILRVAYIIIMATGIAYILVPTALKRIRPTTVSMYNNVQPIIASVIAIIIGQDIFSWDKPLAALLVFTGVYLVTQSKSKEEIDRLKTPNKP